MRVVVDLVLMLGTRYLLLDREGGPAFPSGELAPGESPGEAARRILREATGLAHPKLEVVDVVSGRDELSLVVRALVADAPAVPHRTVGRMELPPSVGRLAGSYVEDALKTSLSYKLTRAP